MAQRDTKVSELCLELGVTKATIYRYVAPDGSLRILSQTSVFPTQGLTRNYRKKVTLLKVLARIGLVRQAFNSPFRPFVLATTSIGQEGLDFHTYCHVVYHWNLPSNPVDLEQREGRVHRFKGHAIRKNVATRFGLEAFRDGIPGGDPWEHLFNLAKMGRNPEDDDLVPYWIYEIENGATVERRVPVLPLSRDAAQLRRLKRSLAVYRLAFGQPRQEDLLAYLEKVLEEEDADVDLDRWRISLSPPSTGD